MKKQVLLFILFCFISGLIKSQIDTLVITGQNIVNNDPNWDGYQIDDDEKTKLIFTNNAITSVNTANYMLRAGLDYINERNNNLDGACITGNKLVWNGTLVSGIITHGLFTGYNINQSVKWNYLLNCPYGIIFKSGYADGNMTMQTGGAAYNITIGGRFGGRAKGINNVRFYNNTFYGNEDSWYLILITTNPDNGTPFPSKNTDIRNNIFYTETKIPAIAIRRESLDGFYSDYNIFWCEEGDHAPVFRLNDTTITWAQWRAEGFDEHSQIINPHFIDNINLVPTERISFEGDYLGEEFKLALSTNAKWEVGKTPELIEQDTKWQVGARIFPTEEIEIPIGIIINCDSIVVSQGYIIVSNPEVTAPRVKYGSLINWDIVDKLYDKADLALLEMMEKFKEDSLYYQQNMIIYTAPGRAFYNKGMRIWQFLPQDSIPDNIP